MNPNSALRKCSREIRRLLRGLPLLVALSLRLGASTYYVDYAAGSDTNGGTSTSTAWKHCPGDTMAAGVPAGLTLVPGDTVNFKGGVTYVLTGTTGIALRWNGVQGSPITYDGNSAGTWGTGRAKFSDNYSANGLTAFSASSAASWLAFKNLEISGVGGSASLPTDTGSAVAPRFGGGIAFAAGAANLSIDACVFSGLGYAFNQKPMAATSLSGTAISMRDATAVSVTNCDFSRMTTGIDLASSSVLSSNTITNCTFHDYVVWTFNLPASGSNGVTITGCSETNNTQFDRASWSGYGNNPRMITKTIAAGTTLTLTASATALPSATYQWQKDGQALMGATSATLVLPSVSSSNAGTYTAVATNNLGSAISQEAVITVTGSATIAPTITTQPVSQTVAALSNVTFTVAASGSPAPTYQWFKNGVSITGATNATLTLSSVGSADAATYYAVATNSAGSATSNSATLTLSSGTSAGSAPVFTSQPVSQTASPLSTVVFSVTTSGTPSPTIQWYRDGVTYSSWTGATLSLYEVSSSDAGNYVAVATNSAGTATSSSATLTVGTSTAPTGTPPVITTQPLSQTVTASSSVTFTVAASGSPTPTFQWFKNGATIAGATATTLTLPSVGSADAATYYAVATNSLGVAQSNNAVLTVNAVPSTNVAPVFTLQPASVTAAAKTTVKFTASASGTPAPTYQWLKDGAAIAGATSSSLSLANVNKGSAGTYTVVATNVAGSATSSGAVLTVVNSNVKTAASSADAEITPDTATAALAPSSRLVNLSVRASAGTGSESLIVGFVVSGNSSKSLLIRGAGPALRSFGITGVLADPTLSLYSGGDLLATNDNWSTSTDAAAIAPASARVGAFALPEASQDAALLTNVGAGVYTGQISGKQSATGTALIELYDAAVDNTEARLVNVSVRTVVRANDDAPTIGFVVAGTEPKRLLIRAVGPALNTFGVANTLSDPRIGIYGGTTRIDENDNWSGATELDEAFKRAGAFPLGDATSKDAALIFTAAPGAYTAVVSAANNASGTVLVEVYELP